jgi:thiol-disulfide isomerase/thioredoxin
MVSAVAQKAIFVGIFVVGVALVYWWSCTCKRAEGFQDSVGNAGSPKYTFMMYGVDWCPHCVSAKPEFAALGPTKTIDGVKVACVLVNPEKEPEKVKQKVEGYPTFHLYDAQGTLVKEYNGPRKTAGFETFLNETVHG